MTTSRQRECIVWVANLPVLRTDARAALLRRTARVGDGTRVASGITVAGDGALTIGAGVFINHGVFIDTDGGVTIGARVGIAPGARIVTTSHELGTREMRTGALTYAPVAIEDGAWIGAGATILPGVTVAAGCVVGAGAVVTRDTGQDGLYVGVPARRVRDLDSLHTVA